ncbi:MAG TPA: hypothetical protein V6C81_25265 [Planktothrix sp.]|jgi:hypothetical protein
MRKRAPYLLALALLGVGSCASADPIFEQRVYADPYYGPGPQVYSYAYPANGVYYSRPYCYYNNDPSAAGFVDRSAKTGIGISAKAAKEAFKAIF